jgi:hypothetical protein
MKRKGVQALAAIRERERRASRDTRSTDAT